MFVFGLLYSAHPKTNVDDAEVDNFPSSSGLGRIGDGGYPGDPMNDRAVGYLLNGKVKNGIGNFGNYIDWDLHPY